MLFFTALIMLLVSACQREVLHKPGSIKDNSAAARVRDWLEEQKTNLVKPESKVKLQNLREHLLLSELRYEEIFDGEMVIVVPINDGFVSANNTNSNPINCLLLFETAKGKIRKGNIVQYMPVNRAAGNKIPVNTFYKFYNSGKIEDSRITFLTITDNFLYEMEYKKGDMFKFSILYDKNAATRHTKRTEDDCIDWYLQTYENGVLVSESYVFTTCGGLYVEEGSGGGGAGGGGGTGYEELEATKSVWWTVTQNPVSGIGEIKSVETIKGKRNSSSPGGGYFTSISHGWSECNFCDSGHPYNVWIETANTVWKSPQSAFSIVTGNLQYQGERFDGLIGTHSWTFASVF